MPDLDKLRQVRDTLQGIKNQKEAIDKEEEVEAEATKLALFMEGLNSIQEMGQEIRSSNESMVAAIQAFKVDVPAPIVPDIKVPEVKVNIPEIKLPTINVPKPDPVEVTLPEIKVPEAKVTVELPEIPTPQVTVNEKDITFPDKMDVAMPDVTLDRPLPVMSVDPKGNYVSPVTGGGGARIGKVTSKQTAKLPNDSESDLRAPGYGFQTNETLGNGETYDSGVLSLEGYTQVHTNVLSDVVGTITINFIRDAGGTDVLRTLTIPYGTADLNVYRTFAAPAFTPYVRYRFTADAAGQTDFYFDTKFLTTALSPQTLGVDAFISPQMVANLGRNVAVGLTPSGSYENVGVTNQRALKVTPPPEGKTAFGEALVGQLVDQVILDFAYGLNTDLVITRANQSGTVTGANALATISSGASANSEARLSSRDICRYVPGHGARARFTSIFTSGVAGNTQTAGIGDTSNGFFFGYNGTSFGILHRRDGKPEVRTLTVTTASTTAEDITITLDGDATATVTVTNSGNTTTTANEIAAHDYSDVGRGWTATALGATVVFESWSSETQSGTYSLSSATTAVGTFAQNVVGTAPTETWVPQASWNGEETFDGTGITGSTLDPTKGNVFQIDYQWLGFGAVYFYIEDQTDGELHLVHTLQYANANTTPSLSIPSQPFTVASVNTSNTSDVSVSLSSAGCFVDGVVEFIGPRKAVDAAKDFGAANAELPILSVDNKLYYQSNINRIAAKGIAISAASTGGKSVTWKILKNATLTDASFVDISTNTSVLQKDTAATAYTGGTEIAAFATGAGSSVVITSGDNNDLLLEPGETITVTADPTANNSDVSVSIRFIELF